jgi:Zn-finger nucleic acid-binding protein
MDCPKCSGKLQTATFDSIIFERCESCNGLWFDLLEKDDLLKIEGSEEIDIGDEQVGAQYRDMQNIDCPRCSHRMMPMVDKDQFHIKYESCSNCFGTFFDAGEFRDLKELSVLERFSKMLSALRTHI